MFEARILRPSDYSVLSQWWLDWGKKPLPASHMPENTIIVSKGELDICAVCLYKTDSAFCILDWFISNRYAPKQDRIGSIEYLISNAMKRAKDLGFKTVFCSVKHPHLIHKLIKSGFDENNTDKNMTNYIGNING